MRTHKRKKSKANVLRRSSGVKSTTKTKPKPQPKSKAVAKRTAKPRSKIRKSKSTQKLKRYYSERTIKVLFGPSGGRCAEPDCTNKLILPRRGVSKAHVAAQICHIYAFSENGPRGRAGLTTAELNAPENLILLCGYHHGIIDGQHEQFPASRLLQWKQQHEDKVDRRMSDVLNAPEVRFPTTLVDKKIEDDVRSLRQARFFVEYARETTANSLGVRINERDLSGGSNNVRAKGLAWCARLLARGAQVETAKRFITQAEALGSCAEIEIAKAFVLAEEGKDAEALTKLAGINSPESRSAALMIASHSKPGIAAQWLKETGLQVTNLSGDGKFQLLTNILESRNWTEAQEAAKAVSDDDINDAPILNHVLAIIHLLVAVPDQFREVVRNQIPFDVGSFPLASDEVGMASRRAAYGYFIKGEEAAKRLNCPSAASVDGDYALWLELRDPTTSGQGRQRLETNLRDPSSSLRLVPFALHFGIKLDIASLERQIDQEAALHGQLTREGAVARFSLAFTQSSPEEVANYVAKHRDDLARYLDTGALSRLEFEMLARAKLFDRAKECLARLEKLSLSEAESSRLKRILSEAEGADPLELKRAQFERTQDLSDLINLVDELEEKSDWESICNYGEALFNRTHTIRDAVLLARALNHTGRDDALHKFLTSNRSILEQSSNLKILYCWSLYRRGDLLTARSELDTLGVDPDDPNYRGLKVNIAIAIGDWNALSGILASESGNVAKRSAKELIGAAQLAVPLGVNSAKDLIYAAANKGSEDPAILAACYYLATQAGWEDDGSVHEWLAKAAALSKEDGPIQKMSLRDLLDRKPEWDRRESATWEQFSRGDIPCFLAAEFLNRSIVDLMLTAGFANLAESDPRRRRLVPAYSGRRGPVSVDASGAVGIDATALLTLSLLDLLGEALAALPAILLPHSTLPWLFQEKQKAVFHQPSRIKDAHLLRNMMASGSLEKFAPSAIAKSDLAEQIGDELAEMIADAEKRREEGGVQTLVVRSSPVHRIGSLMEEHADLTSHYDVLVSCQSIVEKLRRAGRVTAEEEKRALAYLKIHELRWPSEPDISDNAALYLDDVAVSYFIHLRILDRLHKAGFKVYISRREVADIDAFISYEGISSRVVQAIEAIRKILHARILNGTARIAAQPRSEETKSDAIWKHPTYGALTFANQCSSIISDDRFVNQNFRMNNEGVSTTIYTSLDIINMLAVAGSISAEQRLELRTRLRQAGFMFFPVLAEELQRYLLESAVKDGYVIETAELRAIRESLLQARMTKWLQMPKEEPYLDLTLQSFLIVLRNLWASGSPVEEIIARSDWIIEHVDVRGWAHRLDSASAHNLVKNGRARLLKLLLDARPEQPPDLQQSFWNWIEDRVFQQIQEIEPELFAALLEQYKQRIDELTKMEFANAKSKKASKKEK